MYNLFFNITYLWLLFQTYLSDVENLTVDYENEN